MTIAHKSTETGQDLDLKGGGALIWDFTITNSRTEGVVTCTKRSWVVSKMRSSLRDLRCLDCFTGPRSYGHSLPKCNRQLNLWKYCTIPKCTRTLRDKKVQLAKVRPNAEIGYSALRSIDDGMQPAWRCKADRRRLYE
jgi:hypothetical protein